MGFSDPNMKDLQLNIWKYKKCSNVAKCNSWRTQQSSFSLRFCIAEHKYCTIEINFLSHHQAQHF